MHLIISRGYLLGTSPFWRVSWRIQQPRYHPKGTSSFPMKEGKTKKHRKKTSFLHKDSARWVPPCLCVALKKEVIKSGPILVILMIFGTSQWRNCSLLQVEFYNCCPAPPLFILISNDYRNSSDIKRERKRVKKSDRILTCLNHWIKIYMLSFSHKEITIMISYIVQLQQM